LFKARSPTGDLGVGHERGAYFGMPLPSHSVALVRGAGGRIEILPVACDVCGKLISDYPFIAKHSSYRKHHLARRRKYHLACALSVGLVSLIPMEA